MKRAAAAKRRAEQEYRAALVAAIDSGASFADVAAAARVSRQAVRVAVTRARRTG